jgi:hypothetical protein
MKMSPGNKVTNVVTGKIKETSPVQSNITTETAKSVLAVFGNFLVSIKESRVTGVYAISPKNKGRKSRPKPKPPPPLDIVFIVVGKK